MTDVFDLYKVFAKESKKEHGSQDAEVCAHTHAVIDNSATLCTHCGMEIKTLLDEREELPNGQQTTVFSVADPMRCYIRKVKDKTIYPDVEHMNISDHIKDIANNIYEQVCDGKVHRGAYRRAIIFASIFHAYKLDKNPQSCESLIHIFEIKRKDALKGLKFINEHAPKSSPIRNIYITPEHLIHEFLMKFNVSADSQNEILELYRRIKGRSTILNRSRPQSVAASVIWYWLVMHSKCITLKDFVKKVNLSELTVNKIAKEIASLNNTTEYF